MFYDGSFIVNTFDFNGMLEICGCKCDTFMFVVDSLYLCEWMKDCSPCSDCLSFLESWLLSPVWMKGFQVLFLCAKDLGQLNDDRSWLVFCEWTQIFSFDILIYKVKCEKCELVRQVWEVWTCEAGLVRDG